MTLPTRSTLGVGYSTTAPTERQYVASTYHGWRGELPPLIYCHGSGDTAETVPGKSGQAVLLAALAQRYTVVAADLGLQVWGNDTHIARVADAVAYAASLGATGKVTIVTASMGTLGGLGYLLRNPGNVRAAGCVIPALDLEQLLSVAASEINAAYPPAYDDAVNGPTHSPVKYAASLPTTVPIHLLTSSTDAIVLPSTADAFMAARPATKRTDIGTAGHSEASILAAVAPLTSWLLAT